MFLINDLYHECDFDYKAVRFAYGQMGKETAENLTTFIENKINQELDNKINIFATKEDLAKAVDKLDAKISECKKDISNVRNEISASKSETIKWMFIFWIGQVAAFLAFS